VNGTRLETPTRPPKRKRVPAQQQSAGARGGMTASGLLQPCWFLIKCLMPFVILGTLGAAILYVRLLNGPISLAILAAPISRSIAAELPGISVAIEDALVRLTDSGTIEFRMRNVRFNDADGAPMAIAPLAAVGMSAAALWSGRIAPDKVVLIEPRLLVVYGEGQGLSLSFSKPPPGDAAAPDSPAPPQIQPTAVDGSALQQIDLGRLIAQSGQGARRGSNAVSFLREIGVRNATIILDRGGRQTVWTVLEGNIDLEHKKRRSTVAGTLSFASAAGPWSASFKIEEAEKANAVMLEASIRDLVPRGLAALAPEVPLLETIDAPLFGQGRVELRADGGMIGAELQLQLGRGAVLVNGFESQPMAIDGGNLDIRYDAAARQITIAPSTFQSTQSRVTVVGSLKAEDGPAGKGYWTVDLTSTEGQLSSDDFKVPPVAITEASLQGRLASRGGVFTLTQARLRAGGAQIDATGEIGTAAGGQAVRLDGRFGPATADVVKAIWPRLLAPAARRWVGRQVTRGRITGGTFKVALGAAGRETAAGPAERRISMTLEANDLTFAPGRNIAAIEAPRALLRIEGDGLEISIPDATSQVAAGSPPSTSTMNGRPAKLPSGCRRR
jgi:hypothetical protein